jgi:hypothetical protein
MCSLPYVLLALLSCPALCHDNIWERKLICLSGERAAMA